MAHEMRKRLLVGSVLALSIPVIKFYEGYHPKAYIDPVGILTACYGHTGDVVRKTYNQTECEKLLTDDVLKALEGVNRNVLIEITKEERAAYTSFVFNVGEGAFRKSTMLKKLNSGDRIGACNELSKWVYAGGKKLNGLVKRREAERKLCLTRI